MSNDVAMLLNPVAGGGKRSARVVQAFGQVFGGAAPVLTTVAPGADASALHAALRALPTEAVLCIAGGDGTLHHAVNALEPARGQPPWPRLAHVPIGSANDGARALAELTGRAHGDDLVGELRAIAARVGHAGHVADLGRVITAAGTRRLFANFAGAGSPADWAEVSTRAPIRLLKRLSTRVAYEVCNLAVIARRRVHALQVGLDAAAPVPRNVFAWFAARARYLGGGIDLGPQVRLDSGALHVVVIDPAPRMALVRLLTAAKQGRGPEPIAAQRARLQLPSPARLNLDGELFALDSEDAEGPVTIDVLPRHVRWL